MKKQRRTRVPKRMNGWVSKATYATNISSSGTGTVVNTYPSNLFGLAVGSSFQLLSANMANGVLDPSYLVNVLSVTVRYMPAYGRSALTGATSGAGEGYAAFQNNFNSSITVATNTVSLCKNSRPIYTGEPFVMHWKPQTPNDRLSNLNTASDIFVGGPVATAGTQTGFLFMFYLQHCSNSLNLGELLFEFVLSARFA
jgi:hypothetical protein